ncbi:recombination regulator RecX [Lactococcus nasutitermitis]|uniref:Regulatory protein RecX n=1 Tax=Lactococcus nasutitermitis TaxID=1652957 RepID=A0ABV9JGX3_9LACT|nr:recombination regulator RecX [Lactococcus nasutitermitis]
MVKITEIKKLKRLYKITFDSFVSIENQDEVDKIYVCEDTIVHFMLTRDKSFSDEELSELVAFDNFAQGKSLALYYISFKSRTAGEVRKYLVEHEIVAEQIEQILSNLTENGLVNDVAYAENYIQGKIAMASAGPFQIKQKLMIKGISGEIIADSLEKLYDETVQIEIATKLADKTVKNKFTQLPLNQLKQKITQNLMNKGFTYNISAIALDNLELEANEENEQELLYNELDKAVKKYSRNYGGYDLKNRVTQALARKGFNFSDISSALRDIIFDD